MENFKLEKIVAALLGGQAPLPGSNPALRRKLLIAPTRHTPQLATLAKPPEVSKRRFHRKVEHGQLAASDCLKWQYLAQGRWNARSRLTDRQKLILYLTQPIRRLRQQKADSGYSLALSYSNLEQARSPNAGWCGE